MLAKGQFSVKRRTPLISGQVFPYRTQFASLAPVPGFPEHLSPDAMPIQWPAFGGRALKPGPGFGHGSSTNTALEGEKTAMATHRKYGRTWWGAAWLKALRDVPDENRLARGRSYYAHGDVFDVRFDPEKLQLQALVSGSAYCPYEACFTFSPLGKADREKLLAVVSKDEPLVAEILDGNLPERLIDVCRREGIALFPTSWRELHPTCTCPDASAFCKHLAALFYLLLDQIDADPFMVFLTRGVDLRNELRKSGVDLRDLVQEKPRLPAELVASCPALRKAPVDDELIKNNGTDKELRAVRQLAALERLRSVVYTGLPDMSGVLASLLPERFRPAMPTGEKTRILVFLRLAERSLREIPENGEESEDASAARNQTLERLFEDLDTELIPTDLPESARLLPMAQLASDVEPRMVLGVVFKKPHARKAATQVLAELRAGALARTALTLPARTLGRLLPEIECFAALARAARALLFSRAITPIPVVSCAQTVRACPRLWWTPMMREPRVAALVGSLAEGISPWAFELVAPKARKALGLAADDPRLSQKVAFFVLTSILNSLIAGACAETAADLAQNHGAGAQTLIEAAVDVTEFDGRVPELFVQCFTRYFRAFLLADAYPWRPVLTARIHPDGVKLNFGILARDASSEAPAAAEAEATADSGSRKEALAEAAAPVFTGVPHPTYDLHRPVMLQRLLKDAAFAADRFMALNVIRTLAEACPVLSQIAATHGRPMTLDSRQLKDFLLESAPVLMVLGVTVMLPQSLRRILTPRLVVSASAAAGSKSALLDKDAIADFKWQAALGDHVLTEEELRELATRSGEIVRFGEDFVYLDPETLARLAYTIREQPQPTYLEKMRALLTGECEGAQVRLSPEIGKRLEMLTEVSDVRPPAGLRARLRPYQARGYAWLMKNLHLGLGALIADDMGLGKTLQVIAAVTKLKEEGELSRDKVLAVVPTTLMTNWTRELAKFSPSLTVGVYHGPDRRLPAKSRQPDVTITTYGTLRRDAEVLSSYGWRLLVLDEAQAVKNAATTQSLAVRSIKASQVIAMTGTPVENRLMEYWSILEIVQPRLLGSAEDFSRTFALPIENGHDPHAVEAFRRLTAPFMLRRLKSDKSIIADLPEKNSIDQFTTLTTEQAALYQKTLETLLRRIDGIDDRTRKAEDAAERNALRVTRRAALLTLITSLKQICNSPSQYLGTDTAMPDSGKGTALLETLERCQQADRKVLIFTQYREMGERLQRWIQNATGETVDFLHGAVPIAKRQSMVDRFQNDRTVRTMIVSLKAGGTGLNLTAASAVIHYDLWWNPAVEAQATDRAYRIGQRRDVLVYRFVTAGTFEERINEMLTSKRELADLTVAVGETWIGDLPGDELKTLFALDASAAPGRS